MPCPACGSIHLEYDDYDTKGIIRCRDCHNVDWTNIGILSRINKLEEQIKALEEKINPKPRKHFVMICKCDSSNITHTDLGSSCNDCGFVITGWKQLAQVSWGYR